MKEFLTAFSFGVLLRNFFAGVFFLIGFCFATGQPEDWDKLSGSTITAAGTIAVVAGVIVYALHRALVNPIIEWARYSPLSTKARGGKLSLVYMPAARAAIQRWDNSSDNLTNSEARSRAMKEWADYIHLLYTSSFCLGVGSFSGWIFCSDTAKPVLNGWLVAFGTLMFVAALVSDWRRHRFEELIVELNESRHSSIFSTDH